MSSKPSPASTGVDSGLRRCSSPRCLPYWTSHHNGLRCHGPSNRKGCLPLVWIPSAAAATPLRLMADHGHRLRRSAWER